MASIDRILQFIGYKGISKREFYASVDLSNGYLDKTKTINSDVLERINYKYPELDILWVINGKGEMLKTEEKPTDTPTENNHLHESIATLNTNTPATTGKGTTSKRAKLDPQLTPNCHFTASNHHGR